MPHFPYRSVPVRLAVAFLAAVFFSLSSPPSARAAPLPVETFFKKPDYTGTTLSPSGRYVAVIAPIGDHHGIGIIDLDTGTATRMSTVFGDGDVVWVGWQTDARLLVRLGDWQSVAGEPPRDFGLFAVNRDGSDSRRISGRVVHIFHDTNAILIEAAHRSRRSRDLYRYDTVANTEKLLTFDTPGNVVRWVVDFDGVPRAAVTGSVDDDTSAWYVRASADSRWVKVEEARLGRLQSVPMQFDPDGKILYVSARRSGSDFAAIYEYDVASGTWKGPVVRHPQRDIDAQDAVFVVDYAARKLLGLRYADDRPVAVWFDPEWARIQKSVDAALPDTVNGLAHEGNRWLVVSASDRNPGEARILDAKTMQMKPLVVYRPWIDPQTMASTTWVRYPARDGISIPALLTLPLGPRDRPVPLIVDIHGGPNVQATGFGFDAETQFFASRGYAVLRPQFRGTQGFGWKLESAGFRHWGEEMQDDLEDGVKWAVAEKIADPAHVCFYGWSYGGYAAAWGAIRNAATIKCAVALAAVTSLDYMFDNAQTDMSRVADRSTLLSYWVGDPKTDRARFKRVSPLDNADKVGVPIFLAYGASDVRVPLVHGADFHSALDKNHKPHEWVVYNDEGHGFNRDENRFDLYRRVEQFLAKYLASPH